MSKKVRAAIRCPQCSHETETDLYRTIWVEYPDNRALIFNNAINVVTCSQCKLSQRVDFPFLATNVQRHIAVWYEPYPDEQIDIDVNLYRRQFGPDHFFAKAPRIREWEAFKQTLVKLETAAPQPRAAAPRSSREAPMTGQAPKSAKRSSLLADLWGRVWTTARGH